MRSHRGNGRQPARQRHAVLVADDPDRALGPAAAAVRVDPADQAVGVEGLEQVEAVAVLHPHLAHPRLRAELRRDPQVDGEVAVVDLVSGEPHRGGPGSMTARPSLIPAPSTRPVCGPAGTPPGCPGRCPPSRVTTSRPHASHTASMSSTEYRHQSPGCGWYGNPADRVVSSSSPPGTLLRRSGGPPPAPARVRRRQHARRATAPDG